MSSDKLEAALCFDPHSQPLWRREVSNTASGIDALLALAPQEAPWVVEPTGRYSLLVVQRAQAAGRKVLLAPPRQAKLFLKSLQSRAKTDKLDGRGLALFGHSRSLPVYCVKSENVEKLDQLLSARKLLSRQRISLTLQAEALPHAQAALKPAIEAISQQINALDKQISSISTDPKQYPEFASTIRLLKVPGIGRVTAAAIASRLSAKQFAHPDQFVAYIGMDVGVRQSGKRIGYTGLTKQGDAELRRLLFVCAKAAVSGKDNPFKAQYLREKEKGLSPTAALCAVARKMACVCWSIHKHGTEYDPTRVSTRPQPKDQTDNSQQDGNTQHSELEPV